MRYVIIAIFVAIVAALLAALEWALVISGSGISLSDRNAGNVILLLVVIGSIFAFTWFEIGISPFEIVRLYLGQWRRALKGMVEVWLAVSALVAAVYLWFALQGAVTINDAAVAAFGWRVAERTAVAVFVVFILALSEEIVFRVFLMGYLRKSTAALSTIAAVIVSSLVFAAVHKLNDPLGWFNAQDFPLFVGLTCLGILLCVTYIATGSIFCAIGVHAGFLGSKVFLRKTELLSIDQSALFLSETTDLRMSPVVWALFLGLALVIYLLRHRLQARYRIEDVVGGEKPKRHRTISDVLLRLPRPARD